MGFSGAAHGWGGGGEQKALTMMKLGTVIPYPKKIEKIYESCDTPLEFYFHRKSANFAISRNTV